jgi:flagellar biosynthetic protein FliR
MIEPATAIPATLSVPATGALVACRLGGMAATMPLLAGATVPWRIRAGLVAVLAACATPVLLDGPLAGAATPATTGELLAMAAAESAVGAALGFLFLIPFLALRTAGAIVSPHLGFGFARLFDPASGEETDPVERLLLWLGVVAFLSIGGLEATLLAAVRSFEFVRLGGAGAVEAVGGLATDGPLVSLLAGLVAASLELSVRIATPVVAILLAESLVSGMLSRNLPAFNLLGIGFPLRVILGLGGLLAALGAMHGTFRDWLLARGSVLDEVVRLGGGA